MKIHFFMTLTLVSVVSRADGSPSLDGLTTDVKQVLSESFNSGLITGPKKQSYVVDALKEMRSIETKYEALDVDAFLAAPDFQKLDDLKNEFMKYNSHRNNINELFKKKQNSANYIKDEDAATLDGIEYPYPEESFSDSKVLQKLRGSLKPNGDKQLADNIVYKKFKLILYKSVPAIETMIVKKAAELKSRTDAKEAEAEKKRLQHEKVLNSPDCNKIAKFEEYCGRKRGEASMRLAFENEKKLNSRSGTVRPAAMRGYNAELMNYETQLAQLKKEFNSIRSSVISLNDCQVVRNKEVDAIDFVFAPKLTARLKKAFNKYCDVEWNEN